MKTIYFQNNPELQQKIKRIQKGGVRSLHFVSDFDKTLTPAFVQGKSLPSSYALIREGKYLTPEYVSRAYAEYDKYHPYEVDHYLSLKEKSAKMVEWWEHHWQLMVECGINKKVFEDIIQKGKIQLREGSVELFSLLHEHTIPFLIFSSGLGNLIELFLKKNKFLTPNVHLLANFFTFDENGIATGFKRPLIHVFNKNEYELRDTPYYREVKQRRNVILLGDSLGDLGMIEGLQHDTIIRIGFLNEDKALLDHYLQVFDVVITEDGPVEEVNRIIKAVL
ncbi:hypothetical protein J4421_01315 [Candidatus Woesearchaeota archaeon]|nr:hypothetical protein [Candidatus Woesearchaeota archaeon]